MAGTTSTHRIVYALQTIRGSRALNAGDGFYQPSMKSKTAVAGGRAIGAAGGCSKILTRTVCLAEADGIERDLTVSVTQVRTAIVETPCGLQRTLGIETPLFDIAEHRRYFESRLIEVCGAARVGDRFLDAT